MALVECPDCGRKISHRAKECPDCSCPVAEVMAEERAADARTRSLASREATEDAVDCPQCKARGFFEAGDGEFMWCVVCEHSGRATLCKADDGYYAVARYAVERFLAGELHPETSGVVFRIGKEAPTGFRFPKPSPREEIDPEDSAIPWELDAPK